MGERLTPDDEHAAPDQSEEANPDLGVLWADRIDRSLAELEAGQGTVYDSEEEFLASLD